MKKKLLIHRTGCLLATAFFLLIAWATSVEDDEQRVNTLPLGAKLQDQEIMLYNVGLEALDSLTLVLNGVYSIEQIKVPANSSILVPLQHFTDRHGASFPEVEQPHRLEVYYNGNGEPYRGGYFKHTFE